MSTQIILKVLALRHRLRQQDRWTRGQLEEHGQAGSLILSAMVELAARRAARAGLSERVQFEVGDVAALPLSDGEFDGVVSTLSLHHWSDPASGLAEIHRVLKPDGGARIYDLAHWLWPPARGGDRLAQLVAASPFGEGEVEIVRWPGSVPAFVVLRLRRAREVQS